MKSHRRFLHKLQAAISSWIEPEHSRKSQHTCQYHARTGRAPMKRWGNYGVRRLRLLCDRNPTGISLRIARERERERDQSNGRLRVLAGVRVCWLHLLKCPGWKGRRSVARSQDCHFDSEQPLLFHSPKLLKRPGSRASLHCWWSGFLVNPVGREHECDLQIKTHVERILFIK